MPEARHCRIDDVECLRALAVIGVAIHHSHGGLYAPNPWFDAFTHALELGCGVDLFFAISGFVIGCSFLPQMQAAIASGNGWRTAFAFWVRRFFRLTPSAWLWLWLVLLAVFFFNESGVFGSVHANLMATFAGMFDYANFRFAKTFFHDEYGVSAVYWSLSLEEQFYLLLPLCMLLLRRWLPVLLLVVIVWQAQLPARTPLLICLRTDAIAWGVLLSMAYGSTAWRRLEPTWLERPWLRWPVVALLLLAPPLVGNDYWDPWSHIRTPLIAIASAAIVWLASYNRNYLFRPEWLRKPMRWIGARSYAIYLIHMPVYFFILEISVRMREVVQMPTFLTTAVYTLVAIALIAWLADVNYRFIETPLRRYGARLADRLGAPRSAPQSTI